jgi:phosphoglucosamine mutase
MVGAAVLSGLLSAGVDVTVAGVLPTPAVARLTRSGRFGLGIVISASHNPAGDNGVKVFVRGGRKADPDFEREVEGRVARGPSAGTGTGEYRVWHSAGVEYVKQILADFEDLSLAGTTIVADCANGATSATAPAALESLGATVIPIHSAPNGRNINRRCGALHPRTVAREVSRSGADVGVSFDGDGDRALFADEKGRVVDGDATMAALARDLLSRRALPKRTVVATVMSNVGLERSLREVGVALKRAGVGDRQVVAEMDSGGYRLGGEQSGHIVVKKGGRLVGDGLETTLHLLRARARSKSPLSELTACFERSPQHLENIVVREKPPLEEIGAVARAVREVEDDLAEEGRVLVRYSGTEPLARVMVEGPDRRRTLDAALKIAEVIRREIGT